MRQWRRRTKRRKKKRPAVVFHTQYCRGRSETQSLLKRRGWERTQGHHDAFLTTRDVKTVVLQGQSELQETLSLKSKREKNHYIILFLFTPRGFPYRIRMNLAIFIHTTKHYSCHPPPSRKDTLSCPCSTDNPSKSTNFNEIHTGHAQTQTEKQKGDSEKSVNERGRE